MEKGMVKQAIFDVLRAVAIALVFNIVAVLIASIVVKYTGISASAATAVNQVLKVISIASGSILGIRSHRLGWALGAIVGLLYTTIGFGVFSLLAGASLFANVSVFDFLIGLAAGVFSGILAVNLRSLDRKPRPGKRARKAAKAQ